MGGCCTRLAGRLGVVGEVGATSFSPSTSRLSDKKLRRSCNCVLGLPVISRSSDCCDNREDRRAGGGWARPLAENKFEALDPRRGWVAKSCVMTESVGEGATFPASRRPPTSKNETLRPPPLGLGIGSSIAVTFRSESRLDCDMSDGRPGNCQDWPKGACWSDDDKRFKSATGAGLGTFDDLSSSSGFVL